MARPKTPSQRKQYKELRARLMKYALLVNNLYDKLNLEAAKRQGTLPYFLSDNPSVIP